MLPVSGTTEVCVSQHVDFMQYIVGIRNFVVVE